MRTDFGHRTVAEPPSISDDLAEGQGNGNYVEYRYKPLVTPLDTKIFVIKETVKTKFSS